MNWKVALLLIAVIAVGVWGWYLQRQFPATASVPLARPAAPPVAPVPPAPAEPAATDASGSDREPVVTAPAALDNSDAQVHAAVVDFAAKLAQWLTPEEQIRKWVVLVDQIAAGKLPVKNRPLNYPMPAFMVQRQNEKLLLDNANHARADLLIDVFTAIPIDRLADYYHAWRPLLDKAYAELGGGGGFDKRLRAAIKRVVSVRPLTAEPELIRPIVYYHYADEKLEGASDVEKLMWRLGPQNTRRVQDYLRRLEPEL